MNSFIEKKRRGMTLVEVLLGTAILAILAVLAMTSLFYPRYLAVTSALEQNAIHAGSSDMERYLHNYSSPAAGFGQFRVAGWNLINGVDIVTTAIPTNDVVSGAVCRFLRIKTTVTYRDGKTVQLETCRSLEVLSSSR